MLLVLLGRKFMPVDRGFHLKTSSLMGSEFTSVETPILSVFFAEFQRDPEKHTKILADCVLRREIKRILDIDEGSS